MPWNPWSKEFPTSLGDVQDEVNRFVGRLWHAGISTGPFDGQDWAPVVDLYESADNYKLWVDLPGVDGKAVEVCCVGRTLTIRGERATSETETAGFRPIRRERRFGSFCRSVDLPVDVDADKISARCAQGVLEIMLPKAESSRVRTIRVEPGE
jgi:HSP20 family protein